MRSALSSCRLYSWMRLTWQSKIVSGSTVCPAVDLQPVGELRLGLALGLAERRRGSRRRRRAASSCRSSAEIGDPAVADRVGDRAGERRVGQQQPAPRRDAVGLVVEALGEHLGQVLDRRRAQQLGVDRGHAVGAVRADDRQVGHADSCARRPPRSGSRARRGRRRRGSGVRTSSRKRRLISKMISRCRGSSSSNQAQRPFLQRLGQQRVVGVGQRPPREVPGLVPAEVRLVEQDAHQLGDGHAPGACR